MGLKRILPLLLSGCLVATPAVAQTSGSQYPSKPITLVIPYDSGTLVVVGRLVATKISDSMKQPVVVDNRIGAGGNIGSAYVAKAAPDGYTLLHNTISLAAMPALYKDLPFDPVRDFAPIVRIVSQPFIMASFPGSSFTSVKGLVEAAKGKPGQLAFGSAGVGTLDHLAMEFFDAVTGVKMIHVPYKGGSPVVNDLMAGRISVAMIGGSNVPFITGGKLTALAVTSHERIKLLPNTPTMAEAGYPQYEVESSSSFYAPANTPTTIVAKLNEEVNRALKLPEVRDQLETLGQTPMGGSPEEASRLLRSQAAQWKKVIDEANIHAE